MANKIKELPQFTSLTDMANQYAISDDKAVFSPVTRRSTPWTMA
jgi:hypothetical protein